MVKLTVLFKRMGEPIYEELYNRNLALLEIMPHIRRREVSVVMRSPQPDDRPPFGRMLEFYFDDWGTMETALASTQGLEAGRYLMQFVPHDVLVMYSEVYEE